MPVTQMGTAQEWKEPGLRVSLGPCPWAGVGLRLGDRTCSDHTATPAWTAWVQLVPVKSVGMSTLYLYPGVHLHQNICIYLHYCMFPPPLCLCLPSFLPPPPLSDSVFSLGYSGLGLSLSVLYSVSLSLSLVSLFMTVFLLLCLCVPVSISLSLYFSVSLLPLCPCVFLPISQPICV